MTTTSTATERDDTILILRRELKRRSGKTWSVKGGRGTSWGWITISAPPARSADRWGTMTETDRQELSELLGERVSVQGASVPDSRAYRTEYVDRVRGLHATPAAPYWD